MAQPISFRWEEEFIAAIDAARGKTKRSPFVRAAVEAHLAALNANGAALAMKARPVSEARAEMKANARMADQAIARRGSPSPSLERFAGPRPKTKGAKR